MYRFLLSPKWLVGHALIAVVAMTFVSLGLWQLDRHEERTSRNALVAERMSAPAVDLDELDGRPVSDLAYRRVTVSGHYAVQDELLLTPRSWNGQPGHHVLTPLATAEGDAVLVDRGWVPYALADPPVAEAVPPDGRVQVTGLIFPDEPAARFGPAIAAEGRLTTVSRVGLERLQPQVDLPLRRFYVQLESQSPAGGRLPVVGDPPDLTAGNHLSYAVQWFLFTAVGVIGYPLLARRTALERREQLQAAAEGGVASEERAGLADVP